MTVPQILLCAKTVLGLGKPRRDLPPKSSLYSFPRAEKQTNKKIVLHFSAKEKGKRKEIKKRRGKRRRRKTMHAKKVARGGRGDRGRRERETARKMGTLLPGASHPHGPLVSSAATWDSPGRSPAGRADQEDRMPAGH